MCVCSIISKSNLLCVCVCLDTGVEWGLAVVSICERRHRRARTRRLCLVLSCLVLFALHLFCSRLVKNEHICSDRLMSKTNTYIYIYLFQAHLKWNVKERNDENGRIEDVAVVVVVIVVAVVAFLTFVVVVVVVVGEMVTLFLAAATTCHASQQHTQHTHTKTMKSNQQLTHNKTKTHTHTHTHSTRLASSSQISRKSISPSTTSVRTRYPNASAAKK